MKLALVRRRFAATGGAELYVQRLLGALARAGHEVHLLAEEWTDLPVGVRLHTLPVTGSRSARPVRFAEAVEAELGRGAFDCVFSLERTRRQDVYRAGDGVHRVWLQRRRQFAPWWRRPWIGLGAFHRNVLALERQTFDPARTRRVIVNSGMVRAELVANFGFPEDRIHLVRNGIDVARFRNGRRAETRSRWGVREDQCLLLFVGSGWERKGLKFLLAALSQLPADQFRLLVLGKGSAPRRAPPNVQFAAAAERVEDACAAADVFTFLPIYEPSANVCCEALAAGLPVVTTRQNGAAELIEPGRNGTVIASPADTDAVVAAIRDWAARRRERPVPVSADLSLDRNVAETLAVLELAARERRG